MTAPPNALQSSEWFVETAGLSELVDLVERYHYAGGAANTAVARHGLFRSADGPLARPIGAALWMPPTNRAAERTVLDAAIAVDGLRGSVSWRGVLTLSRLVVEPGAPTNAASFLMGRSMRLIDRGRWPILATYADTNQGHTGAIYRATNWIEVGEVPAGDVWVDGDGLQRGRKRGGRNLSVAEMTDAGFVRAAAAPKIKFIHVAKEARA